MTISRMQLIHKLQISNQDNTTSAQTKRALVKYLADTQGLAPSETQDYRYLIEQDLTVIESFDDDMTQMCARCHSGARFALQRRTEQEWDRLVHYHLGQYPSTEYSLYGRDRDWFNMASNETVPELAKLYPLETDAWRDWQAADKPDLAGRWRVVGDMPGKGRFVGTMTSEAREGDGFGVSFSGNFENGESLEGEGQAIVYTGYEWRASLSLNGKRYRQVLAASEDGSSMKGRVYDKANPELGIRTTLYKDTGASQLLTAVPGHIRPGETATLTLHGTALAGDIDLGPGIEVVEITSRDKDRVSLSVKASAGAATGPRTLSVGKASLDQGMTVYQKIDSLRITPAYAIARLGENGGTTPKSLSPFTAIGIDHGADGKAGTADDIEIGAVQAKWTVEPFDEAAARDQDVKFAGVMDTASGLFTPAGAGPNPARTMSTNNAGNLKVIAMTEQDGVRASGEAQLIVTVQRWNNPPLK